MAEAYIVEAVRTPVGRRKGGLGAVATDVTGFGVAWGVHLIRSWIDN